MKEPSEKRKRTLALHDRALRFTTDVNLACPHYFTSKPSATAWELAKIRMASLDHHKVTEQGALESEASQLSSIYATIIVNMRTRLEREKNSRRK